MAGPTVQRVYCWQIRLNDLEVYLASSDKGAMRIGLSLGTGGESLAYFSQYYSPRSLMVDRGKNRSLARLAEAALCGGPSPGQASLDVNLTSFHCDALQAIARIPFGETRTYGQVASMLGKPGAARAVGQAMGRNPLPLIFP